MVDAIFASRRYLLLQGSAVDFECANVRFECGLEACERELHRVQRHPCTIARVIARVVMQCNRDSPSPTAKDMSEAQTNECDGATQR